MTVTDQLFLKQYQILSWHTSKVVCKWSTFALQ